MRTRDHMYIRTYHPGSFRAEWEQLFDVTTDPFLTRDLLEAQPDLAARMRSHLSEWWHTYAGTPGALPDPMHTTLQVGPTYNNEPARYMEHLRNTDRGHLAEDLARRLSAAVGATPVSWHAPDVPWTSARRSQFTRQFQNQELD